MLLSLLPYLIHSTTGGALPAVVAGVVVAFLLITLLIAGIIVGMVMLRRMKKRSKKEGEWVERIECTENNKELAGKGQESAIHHEQHVEDLHCESTDNEGQGGCDRKEGNTMRFNGNHCDVVKATKNTPSKDEVEDDTRREEKGQQDDQAKGTPNVVYTVVDKSKKERKEKTQGGASATTTQGVCTEEQHYECSSAFGRDWFWDGVGGKPEEIHVDVYLASPSNDAKETCPRSEPCNPNVAYTVVDKSKKKGQDKTQGGASATTTQSVCTEEQHYEYSSIFGQDWYGDGMGGKPEGSHKQGSQSNDAKGTCPQSQPSKPNAAYTVVDKSKKKRKEKTQGGASATTTQGVCTEEQHYECSSAFGQDWFGDGMGGKPENHEQGSRSNDAKGTCPQSQPFKPNVVYTVVDKSKKKRKEKTQGGASATAREGICTEEQHYEFSSAFGQDCFGDGMGGKPQEKHPGVGQRGPSNYAKGTGPQSEPNNPNAVYTAVNRSTKKEQ